LRFLFFGLREPEDGLCLSRSHTPNPSTHEVPHDLSSESQGEGTMANNEQTRGFVGRYYNPEHLSPETHMSDPSSRTPSPLASLRPSNEAITFDHWDRRYDIHNEAVSELVESLSNFRGIEDASFLRYVLIPLIILALVSRPGSAERTLCADLFEQFTNSMAVKRSTLNPIGGPPLSLDIPWERLDAYSAQVQQPRQDTEAEAEIRLRNAAPEWNWWYMLKEINLSNACK
jgi:hypothetical protein